MRVLVVDDDMVVSMMLSMGLENIELVEATGEDEALHAVAEGNLDAVIVDLRLSEGEGLDLVRRLRRRLDTNQMPIVVLTAGYNPENEMSVLQAGADAYLGKPFEPLEVAKYLEAILLVPAGERRERRQHAIDCLKRGEPVPPLLPKIPEPEAPAKKRWFRKA